MHSKILEIYTVNYKLALTKSTPMTEQQRHLPSASMEIEPHVAIAVDFQQYLREFRVDEAHCAPGNLLGQVFR